MEARIAHLESDVRHLLSSVTDIKADVRGLRDSMDAGHARLSERIDTAFSELSKKIDGTVSPLNTKVDGAVSQLNAKVDSAVSQLNAKFDGLRDSVASTKVWALLLYIALAAVNLGTLARGLGWI
jgi:outer membrane murein-binding lipoprotein Lpp